MTLYLKTLRAKLVSNLWILLSKLRDKRSQSELFDQLMKILRTLAPNQ